MRFLPRFPRNVSIRGERVYTRTVTPPLEIRNLVKTYPPGLEAVKGISFTVHPGECFGLLGPNGAGKSSTINCLTGFLPATSGQVFIHGHNVHDHPKQARQLLGVCSQEDTLDSDFDVLDQLVRHATFFRIPVAEGTQRAKEILERFRLGDRAKSSVESLSGGMRRRLQVARALISKPKVLVLDEPTTGLDPDVRRQLWDVLTEFRAGGGAILLSTHYMDEAERLCDRIAILHQGKILGIDDPQALVKHHVGEIAITEEIRPGFKWTRQPNLEDVFLKLAGSKLA